jgi:ribosomal protein S12 methylthiotransferase accessory factor
MLAPPLNVVMRAVRCDAPLPNRREGTAALAQMLLNRRREFGISRIGAITRLDRIGIPVVQVTRPLGLSNSVSQGKGFTLAHAVVSAVMETLETWAAENIPPAAISSYPGRLLPPQVRQVYWGSLSRGAPAQWADLSLGWVQGLDLLTQQAWPVPLALVDTVYTLPSPHPFVFPRTTTGLGAGRAVNDAVVHAALEILERDAVARARTRPHFFDRHRADLSTVSEAAVMRLLRNITSAGLIVAAWHVPAGHSLPVYWCHIMEEDESEELVPFPAEGSGCALTHHEALARALLEACQARLTAISGAREDVTRQLYPASVDRKELAEWRTFLRSVPGSLAVSGDPREPSASPMARVLEALTVAGAQAAIVVPLFSDDAAGIHVVRMVAPPLRSSQHH